MKPKLALSILMIAAFVSACQYSVEMYITPESTINNLVFTFYDHLNNDDDVGIASIGVYSCSQIYQRETSKSYYPPPKEALWLIETHRPVKDIPRCNKISYGVTPEGMRVLAGPRPVTAPGCYVALAYLRDSKFHLRVASTGFKVEPGGAIRAMSRWEYEKVFKSID